MVESLQLDPMSDGEDNDLESMLTMNTLQHQAHNTNTYHKLCEKSHTTGIFDDKIFEENKDVYFPT